MQATVSFIGGNQTEPRDLIYRNPMSESSGGVSEHAGQELPDEDFMDSGEETQVGASNKVPPENESDTESYASLSTQSSVEALDDPHDISRVYDLENFGTDTLEGLRWLEWKHEFGVSERALQAALKLASIPLSVHHLKSALSQAGIQFEKVDCCPSSHIAFTGVFRDMTVCPHRGCEQKRYADSKCLRPRKCFRYIPLRSRVESWFRSRSFLEKMGYRDKETRKMRFLFERGATFDTLPLEDYIFGRNYIALDGKKRFRSDDVCLALSVDGKNLFKSNDFNVWPVLLFNLNLCPEERCKIKNMVPFGFIPGPNNPKDLQSFLLPLYEELALLESGIFVNDWEGNRRIVRVFLLFVTADLPALSKVILTRGHNALSPCRYCKVHGIYDEVRKTYYYPSAVGGSEYQRPKRILWNPERIDALLRTPSEVRNDFKAIERCKSKKEKEHLCKSKGLHGRPTILGFSTCLVPFTSFPVDIMHLFYENIAPYMWKFLSGGSPQGCSAPFFLRELEQIGVDLLESGKFVPSSFGRRPRNIFTHSKRFKAEEWRSFVLLYSSPLLYGRIIEKYFAGWKHFVAVCQLCSVPHPTREELKKMKECALKFYLHFEKDYFMYKEENVSMMKLVFHLLLHIGRSMEDCGPLCNLDQFKVERYIGTLERVVHSRARAVENLELNIIHGEALKVLRRLLSDDVGNSSPGEQVHYDLLSPISDAELTTHWTARYVTPYLYRKHATARDSSGARGISDLREFGRLRIKDGDVEVTIRSRRNLLSINRDADRMSCHVIGFFDEDGELISWYGRVESFHSFSWRNTVERVALIQWCERLSRTRHGDVFAPTRFLFGRRTMEEIACLNTESLIGLLPRPDQRRIYILDPRPPSSQRKRQGFL